MSPEPNSEQPTPAPKTPLDILATFAGAPTPEQIAGWKQEVPNGVLRVFSPDNKRAFIFRGITGLEMRELQKSIPQNAENPELEFKMAAVSKACIWSNTTPSRKLDPVGLRNSAAGLPETLFTTVEMLSDWFAPAQILDMSFDL